MLNLLLIALESVWLEGWKSGKNWKIENDRKVEEY